MLIAILPAVMFDDFPQTAEIHFPTNDTLITAPMAVTGTVHSPHINAWRLRYRPHRFPIMRAVAADVEGRVTRSEP